MASLPKLAGRWSDYRGAIPIHRPEQQPEQPQVRWGTDWSATDDGKSGFKETEGVIFWINDKAEFTPKTIQTKNERANLVYAIKVKVVNDGSYKLNMYGEIMFN